MNAPRALPLTDSTLAHVLVFRQGALVTRRVGASGLDGGAPVRVGPLPLSLDDDSVQVLGEGGLAVLDSRVVLAPVGPLGARPAADESSFREAQRSVATARAALEAHDQTARATHSVELRPRARPKGQAPGASPSAARESLLKRRGERLMRLAEARGALVEALRRAEETLAEAEERRRLATAGDRALEEGALVRAVDVVIGPDAPDDGAFIVRYLVPGARWSPAYTLLFEGSQAHLGMRAKIAQQTGEDWLGVDLTLSTAAPQRWCDLPKLSSIRLGRRQPEPPRTGFREPPEGAGALFEDYDRALEQTPAPSVPESFVALASASTMETIPGDFSIDAELMGRGADEDTDVFTGAPVETVADSTPEPVMRSGVASFGMQQSPPAPQAAGAAPGGSPMSLDEVLPIEGRGRSRPDMKRAKKESEGLQDGTPGALDIEAELLAFTRLRLAAPTKLGQRGRLRLVGRVEAQVEWLEDAGLAPEPVIRALGEARRRARIEPPLPAPVTDDGFDYAYVGESAVDLPSDGVVHTVSLLDREATCERSFVVVPRESLDAYRFVSVENPLAAPLLGGPADVYVDGQYLLSRVVPVTAPGERLRMGLGVDAGLKVARNVYFEEQTKGLLRGSLDLVHSIAIDIENLRSLPASVEVRDRVPVERSSDDGIEVHEGPVEPSWEGYTPPEDPLMKGGRRWRLSLAPQEKRSLSARYTIRIAQKNELVGGNRREPTS